MSTARARVLCGVLLGLLWPSVADAYSSPSLFAAPTHEGGGGGRHFTGSRQDSLGCDTCHGGGEALELEISGLPQGSWAPGGVYTIDVAWSPTIEHSGLLAEFADPSGRAVGSITLAPEDMLTTPEQCSSGLPAAQRLEPDAERSIVAVGDCGAHRLRMQWRAPEDPAIEQIWVHIAAVRGDGSGDASGDGVFMVREGIERVDLLTGGGCAVQDPPEDTNDRNWILGILIVLGLLASARRIPRGMQVLGLIGASLVASGCARVQPWERGRLAQPDMQMELDGDLRAGPEHAVEYREGSAGGLGGGGGGCGCN